MRVKCISNYIKDESQNKKLVDWANKSGEFEITVGKSYVVLAVSKLIDSYFIYIMGDESDNYPLAFPIIMFEMENTKISKYWDCDLDEITNFSILNLDNNDVLSFSEWKMAGDLFSEKVLEEDYFTLKIFQDRKTKILNEDKF